MGNSKLFLGLGIGAVIGGVLTYLAGTSKGKKMRHDAFCAIHQLGSDAEDMAYAAKNKAEHLSNKVIDKVAGKAEAVKEKVNEFTNNK